MRKSCKYCGRIHEGGVPCAKKPPPKARKKEGRRESSFRSSYAWQKARKATLERDFHLCKLCAAEGRISHGNLGVHHIEPLSERYDLRLDTGNLVSLCSGCHRKADGGGVARSRLRRIAASKVPPLLFRKGKG